MGFYYLGGYTQTRSMEDTEYDSVERVEQIQIGASLRMSCQRGTDVRDDDTVTVDANFKTIDELRAGSTEIADIVIGRMSTLRGFKPDGED